MISRWLKASIVVGFSAVVLHLWRKCYAIHDSKDPQMVFQTWFRSQGGWMSPNLSLTSSPKYYGNALVVSSGNLEHGNPLIEIPRHMILTKQRSVDKFSRLLQKQQQLLSLLETMIQQTFHDPLDQQDIWIALFLMLECSKCRKSQLYPYLQVLPINVPRLASFTEEELKWLQDDQDMAPWGSSQRLMLHQLWSQSIREIRSATPLIPILNNLDSCWNESSFHRFVALSSSRAMILGDGVKYLTPMADMLNHADRPQDSNTTTMTSTTKSFRDYHKLLQNGDKLVVYADRDFQTGDMLVEEYGQLDNSLYITAFGFVPLDNPHHCVILPLPNPVEGVMCVRRDGQISDNGHHDYGQTTKRERILEHMSKIGHDLGLETCSATRTTTETCDDTIQEKLVLTYLNHAAQVKLAAFPTSLEDDVRLLHELDATGSLGNYESNMFGRNLNHNHIRIALQFRIEEKRVLRQLADFQEANGLSLINSSHET